ncbi:MAG TPA: polyprenyl synthetase family protein [Gemmatimonadaceae bacterium]
MTLRTRLSPAAASALQEIQAPVAGALEQVLEDMKRIVVSETGLVNSVSEHLMHMRGKMMRPTLLLLASESEGTRDKDATSYAAVVELIHLATLVHDDAVDHSVLRRGMPTINALFSHQVSVIMGDFLYSRALMELVRLGDLQRLEVLARASNELTIGEIHQLAALDALAFTESDYELLIRAKTAALFAGACEVGALSGAKAHRAAFREYGTQLGMAFQVVDDLLDYTESSATVGKPTGLDLKEHKATLPLIAALPKLAPNERNVVSELFRTPEPTDELVARVIEIVREEGGLDYARRRGEEYARRAEEALTRVPESAAKSALLDTVAYVMERRA